MLKFLLVVALVAVAVYLVVRAAQRGTLRPSRPAPKPRPRQIAPDDDEDLSIVVNDVRCGVVME